MNDRGIRVLSAIALVLGVAGLYLAVASSPTCSIPPSGIAPCVGSRFLEVIIPLTVIILSAFGVAGLRPSFRRPSTDQ